MVGSFTCCARAGYGRTPAYSGSAPLSALQMPVQLIEGSRTTPAARAVIEILRVLCPRANYAKIDGIGHMSPLTHTEAVNEVIDRFIAGRRDQFRPQDRPVIKMRTAFWPPLSLQRVYIVMAQSLMAWR